MAELPDPALHRMAEVVRCLVEIMEHGNWPAVDFQDERAVLTEVDGARGVLGIGEAAGPDRARRAAEQAVRDLMRQSRAG